MTSFLTSNYFELFSLPVQYAMDKDELTRRYRDLQRSVHPDRYASAGDRERRISMQHATRLNEAFEVLRDPVKRGHYLLDLRGQPASDSQQTASDPVFLMQQMELRERLAQVKDQNDPMASLDQLAGEIRAHFRELEQELVEELDNSPADNGKALDIVLKMQFYTRLQEELHARAADLEDEHY